MTADDEMGVGTQHLACIATQQYTGSLMTNNPDDMRRIETAARRIRLIGRMLSRIGRAGTMADGPTRSEEGILALLEEYGPTTAKCLADLEGVRSQTIAQTLDSLDASGWVLRQRSTSDRREVLNSLSEAGAKALENGRGLRQQWLARAFQQRLSADERARLFDGLELLEKIAGAELAE